MDSNHRRRKPADLQSAPFGHSGICPKQYFKLKNTTTETHLYASGDSHRIQTCNLLIRSQMLYSVELANHLRLCLVGVDGFEPPTLCL